MKYLKLLFFSFLIVFFADHLLPGIEVTDSTKLPHVGGDLLFAIVLGFLNSMIYQGLRLLGQPTSFIRIAFVAVGLNLLSYTLLKIIPIGIKVASIEGYLLAIFIVSAGSVLVNYLEMKKEPRHNGPTEPPEML